MSQTESSQFDTIQCPDKKYCISVIVVDWTGNHLTSLHMQGKELHATPRDGHGFHGKTGDDQYDTLEVDDVLPGYHTSHEASPGYVLLRCADDQAANGKKLYKRMMELFLPRYTERDIQEGNGLGAAGRRPPRSGQHVEDNSLEKWKSPVRRGAEADGAWYHRVWYEPPNPEEPDEDDDNPQGVFHIESFPPDGGEPIASQRPVGQFAVKLVVEKQPPACTKHVVELEWRCCYIPMLKHDQPYNYINAYNLSLLAGLAYSRLDMNEARDRTGSVEDVLNKMLRREYPHQVNTIKQPLLVAPAPWGMRYRVKDVDYATYDATGSSCLMLTNRHEHIFCVRGIRKEAFAQGEGHVDFQTAQQAEWKVFSGGEDAIPRPFKKSEIGDWEKRGVDVAEQTGYAAPAVKQLQIVAGVISAIDSFTEFANGFISWDAKVHGAYLEALHGMQKSILRYLDGHGKAPIYMAGHSTGGMLAQELAAWLNRRKSADIVFYGYGSPPSMRYLPTLGNRPIKLKANYRHLRPEDFTAQLARYHKDPSWPAKLKRAAAEVGGSMADIFIEFFEPGKMIRRLISARSISLQPTGSISVMTRIGIFFSVLSAMVELGEGESDMAYTHYGDSLFYAERYGSFINNGQSQVLRNMRYRLNIDKELESAILQRNIFQTISAHKSGSEAKDYVESAQRELMSLCDYVKGQNPDRGLTYGALLKKEVEYHDELQALYTEWLAELKARGYLRLSDPKVAEASKVWRDIKETENTIASLTKFVDTNYMMIAHEGTGGINRRTVFDEVMRQFTHAATQ